MARADAQLHQPPLSGNHTCRSALKFQHVAYIVELLQLCHVIIFDVCVWAHAQGDCELKAAEPRGRAADARELKDVE